MLAEPMDKNEKYMQRCLQLAKHGAGWVSPNPMVGAVLVHEDRILGEGWHAQFGDPHAEVNCINSVKEVDQPFIAKSTLYVSLEPCVHQGKTPACVDLIIAQRIPKVVVACTDSFSQVNGKGLEKLKAAGVEVEVGILEQEARWINRRFFTLQERKRPYIILKWAQSANGFLAPQGGNRVMLSNAFAYFSVQQQRANEAAILVGYQTVLNDNPQLNNRSGHGPQPLRMVTDFSRSLPPDLKIFEGPQPTVVFNFDFEAQYEHLYWHKIDPTGELSASICQYALERNITSIIVEGGRKTLQQFLEADLWDEAFVYQTPVTIQSGVSAPQLPRAVLISKETLVGNELFRFLHFDTASLFGHSKGNYVYSS